jgi:hypothetical protein
VEIHGEDEGDEEEEEREGEEREGEGEDIAARHRQAPHYLMHPAPISSLTTSTKYSNSTTTQPFRRRRGGRSERERFRPDVVRSYLHCKVMEHGVWIVSGETWPIDKVREEVEGVRRAGWGRRRSRGRRCWRRETE